MATASNTEIDEDAEVLAKPPFLRRVRIRGYKSIAFCDVTLEPLTIFVGRNASGKSNFLDALAFLRDVMDVGASEATKRRGGWSSLLCRSSPTQKIEIEIQAGFTCGHPYGRISHNGTVGSTPTEDEGPPGLMGAVFNADYSLEFIGGPHSPAFINREKLEISDALNRRFRAFEVFNGIISRQSRQLDSVEPLPLPHSTELLKVARPDQPLLSLLPTQPYIDLGDGLRQMGFYNFQPEAIRGLQKPNPGWLLEKDGRNLASAIETLKEIGPTWVERVGRYLAAVTELVEGFDTVRYGEYETVRFRMQSRNGAPPLEFDAASMSDGTLRALACLMAVTQRHLPSGPSVVGIEEPETALHPAAMRALVAAMDEATLLKQVLLTTHSPDLLDVEEVKPENVRVVQMIDGRTIIGPADEANVEVVSRELSTLGGLERDDRLEPDLDDRDRQQLLQQAREGSPV